MFSSNKWTCCESREKECEECTENVMVGKWSCCGELNSNKKRCPRSPGAMKEMKEMKIQVAKKMNLSVDEIVSFEGL